MRQYSRKFRDEAITLAKKSSHSYEKIALDLGVNPSTFRNWMVEETPEYMEQNSNVFSINHNDIDLQAEIDLLAIQLANKNEEIEFLKKVVSYFT